MSKRAIFLDGKRSSAAASSTTTTTTTWQITHNDDDGVDTASTLFTDTDGIFSGMEIVGMVAVRPYVAYFRFLNVGIPNAATIDTAKLVLRTNTAVAGGSGTDPDLGQPQKIDAIDTASSTRPASANDVVGATGTSAVVNWALENPLEVDTSYDTTEIKTILQELVNDGSWASGNNITFRVYNLWSLQEFDVSFSTSNARFQSRDQSTTHAAKLTATYTYTA